MDQQLEVDQPIALSSSQDMDSSDEVPVHVTHLMKATRSYLFRIDSVFETLNSIMLILNRSSKRAVDEYMQLIEDVERSIKQNNPDGVSSDSFSSTPEDFVDPTIFAKKAKAFRRTREANKIVPSSLFVSMVSLFDSYFSQLAKGLFQLRPEKLKTIQRTVTLSDVAPFTSIDELKEHLLDAEIDDVLRKSHLEQLKWLAKKFDFHLAEDDDLIKTFVEITERRNLWVHAEGNTSKEYVALLSTLGRNSNATIGKPLMITRLYMEEAHATLFELAVRLSQISWRKCREDHLEDQDSFLHEISYELLEEGRYALARRVLDFACSLKKASNDETRRMYCINRAIAYKFGGKEGDVLGILAAFDWSAVSPKYKMANLVLKDRDKEAIEMMRHMPDNDDDGFTMESYREFPLFRIFRHKADFRAAFMEKFDQPLENTTLETAAEEGKKDLEEVPY